jgi:hypothetical protein
MADTPAQVDVHRGLQPTVTIDPDGSRTVLLGDGIRLRMKPDGTIRLRSVNHQIRVAWLTNKPDAGAQSVLGLELSRKGT